jgi:hypothetical protein
MTPGSFLLSRLRGHRGDLCERSVSSPASRRQAPPPFLAAWGKNNPFFRRRARVIFRVSAHPPLLHTACNCAAASQAAGRRLFAIFGVL